MKFANRLSKNIHDLRSCIGGGKRGKVGSLGSAVNDHGDSGVAVVWRQADDEVHRDIFPYFSWDWDGL